MDNKLSRPQSIIESQGGIHMVFTIIIRYIDAPDTFQGCVRLDADGNANIYINKNLSEAERKRTIIHELGHVILGHFDADCYLSREEKENECCYICAV